MELNAKNLNVELNEEAKMNEKKRKSDIKDLDIITTNVNANYANLIE